MVIAGGPRLSAPTICQRLSAALAQPTAEARQAARQQPVADVDETGAPTGNAATCGGWCFIR
jgi:hypothetical protein